MSTRNRHNPRNVEWRVIAVNERTAEDHAAKLQQQLTELTEEGFTIVSTMPRGEALIITAHRILEPPRQEVPQPPPGTGKMSN